ncbi:RNase H domain-containing protein [Trichonephila clavipes]|nr:RNase H domain-containing protein [Trichonephila clavipes]
MESVLVVSQYLQLPWKSPEVGKENIRRNSTTDVFSTRYMVQLKRILISIFFEAEEYKFCFSFVRGHTGIYGNERADWLAKEATKLSDLIPMSIPKSYHKKIFKEKIISEWNNLYQISNNAHLTKAFIPSIQSRLKAKHFHPNFKLIQFLTGHGNFKAYLKRFNLSPTDQCSCSSDTIQNDKHLILACTKFSSERRALMNCLRKNNIVWPLPFSVFVEGK